MAKLTDKQQRFVDEYLIDLNATQAAIRAGYSPKTSNEQGARLLVNVSVKGEIAKEQAERSKRTGINQDRVLTELAKIAFADMRNFMKWGPNGIKLLSVDDLTPEDSVCVAELSETTTEYGGTTRIKLHDKKGALELLGRHLGMFKDKVEMTGENGAPLNVVFNIPRPPKADDDA